MRRCSRARPGFNTGGNRSEFACLRRDSVLTNMPQSAEIQPAGFSHQASERLFLAIAKAVSPLPNFRGKVRAGLAAYRLLGLGGRHIMTDVTLTRPLKYRMHLDMQCHHERMGLLMGGFEWETPEFFAHCYSGKGYVLNVGANMGLISVPLALLLRQKAPHDQPHVWSIEPMTSNFESLLHNIRLNQLEPSVSALKECVGHTEGEVEFVVESDLRDGEGTGNASIIAADSSMKCNRIKTSITTIDSLVASGKLPANCELMKIDCEGFEYNVLRGATSLLSGSRPVIFGEFFPHCLLRHGQRRAEVVEFMAGFEYLPFRAVPGKDLRFVEFTADTVTELDLLFLPREAVERFRWAIHDCATRTAERRESASSLKGGAVS